MSLPPIEEHVRQALLQLRERRQELVGGIWGVLQETLFSSRAYVRPSDIGRLAAEEADAFLRFVACPNVDEAFAHGVACSSAGLGYQALLRVGRTYRRLLALWLDETVRIQAMEVADHYHEAALQGFMSRREAIILDEQEQIRSALQQTLSRFTLQVETAAEIARATVSILDLGELLTTAVDLITERFSLDYSGVYLMDDDGHSAVLRAGTGKLGRRLLAAGHKLSLDGGSTIAQCIVEGRHLIVANVHASAATIDSSWLDTTRSEIALPLVSRDEVIGALTVQSQRVGAFSSQDAPGLQMIADQLASAISNARLYREAQRRANELAVVNARLQELDRLKDQFMQNVSHELRTPLTIIGGYAEAMLDGSLGPVEKDQREGLDAIFRAAHGLGVLVDDIIAVVEAGARPVRPKPISMQFFCQQSIDEFARSATDKGIGLRADLGTPGSIPDVMAEPNHVRRIIDNLLSNAIKFTPSGGQIRVRCYGTNHRVVLEVEDSGIGIPRELQHRIFDRFFQADGSLHRRYGGTGLGLALVKQFAEIYNGSVTVSSPGIGGGAIFKVVLPVLDGVNGEFS